MTDFKNTYKELINKATETLLDLLLNEETRELYFFDDKFVIGPNGQPCLEIDNYYYDLWNNDYYDNEMIFDAIDDLTKED